MPVIFKNEKKEPLIIEKGFGNDNNPTRFFFMLSPAVSRQSEIEVEISRENTIDKVIETKFRKSLIGWENLVDQDGKEVAFSIEARDFLIKEAKDENGDSLFNTGDILKVIDHYRGETPEKKAVIQTKKKST